MEKFKITKDMVNESKTKKLDDPNRIILNKNVISKFAEFIKPHLDDNSEKDKRLIELLNNKKNNNYSDLIPYFDTSDLIEPLESKFSINIDLDDPKDFLVDITEKKQGTSFTSFEKIQTKKVIKNFQTLCFTPLIVVICIVVLMAIILGTSGTLQNTPGNSSFLVIAAIGNIAWIIALVVGIVLVKKNKLILLSSSTVQEENEPTHFKISKKDIEGDIEKIIKKYNYPEKVKTYLNKKLKGEN